MALAAAEDAMKKTQQQTGVIDVSGQTQVAITSLAQIRAQITAREVAIERLKMGATTQNPDLLQAQAEVAALRNQLTKLDNSPEGRDPLVGASAIPQAGLNYIRSLRDLKYHDFLFELLSKQYEAARIDEGKAAPNVQVVDVAEPPDKKSGPPRSLIVFLGCFFAALIAGSVSYIQYDRALRPGENPSPATAAPSE
jgi:capsule polysaccharide export protein KpsE/RkpR